MNHFSNEKDLQKQFQSIREEINKFNREIDVIRNQTDKIIEQLDTKKSSEYEMEGPLSVGLNTTDGVIKLKVKESNVRVKIEANPCKISLMNSDQTETITLDGSLGGAEFGGNVGIGCDPTAKLEVTPKNGEMAAKFNGSVDVKHIVVKNLLKIPIISSQSGVGASEADLGNLRLRVYSYVNVVPGYPPVSTTCKNHIEVCIESPGSQQGAYSWATIKMWDFTVPIG